MADIGRWGGKAIVNAGSSPTGHTIHMTSNQSWLKVYQDNQSTAIASAGTNTDADDRSATVSITATTVSDPSYEGTASVVCGWTVTQEGTGSTPSYTYRFAIRLQNSTNYNVGIAISTTNNSSGIIASGIVSSQSTQVAFDKTLTLTSSTQPIYMLVETTNSSGSFYMGFGTAPSCVRDCWLQDQGTTQVTTYSTYQWVVPGPNAAPKNGYDWTNLAGEIALYTM